MSNLLQAVGRFSTAEALMALCDRQEASLAAVTTRRRQLDGFLTEAFMPVDARELEAVE